MSNLRDRRHRAILEKEQREQLLNRRFTSNDAPEHTSIEVDASTTHNASLQNAHRGIDDMLMTGTTFDIRNLHVYSVC